MHTYLHFLPRLKFRLYTATKHLLAQLYNSRQTDESCDIAILLTGMNACISVGKLTEARQLLQDMRQQKIPLDIRVFNILLKGYSRRGGVSAVSGILQEMADAHLKPSAVTYNTLIDTYVRAGQLVQARQTCTDAQSAGASSMHVVLGFCMVSAYFWA